MRGTSESDILTICIYRPSITFEKFETHDNIELKLINLEQINITLFI